MGNKTRSVEGGRNGVEIYVRFVAGKLVDKSRCCLEYAKVLLIEAVRDCDEEIGMGRHSWRRNIIPNCIILEKTEFYPFGWQLTHSLPQLLRLIITLLFSFGWVRLERSFFDLFFLKSS